MEIIEIRKRSDNYTDETVSDVMARSFIDEAISIINSYCNLSLPLLKEGQESYDALSDYWQSELLVNWVNYGVKMNDTSLQEAMMYKNRFEQSLARLQNNVTGEIKPEFWGKEDGNGNKNLEGFGGVFLIDTTNAIDWGWFGSGRGNQ